VVSANGFAGTVATATTTPAITLSTTITGILQGNGTAISAATTTGTGSVVLATGPVMTLTNATGLPITAGTTGTLGVTRGGTGVTTISALSAWVANSADTITEVTPGAGNSIRVNAGGTAWEAFTPGTGNVTKVGTPVNDQVAVWTGDGTLEGTSSLTFDGGLTATVGNTVNKDGITINQNDTTNNPDAFVVNNAGTGDAAFFVSTLTGAVGPHIALYHNSSSPANADVIGTLRFDGEDAGGAQKTYASITSSIKDVTSGQADGYLFMNVLEFGTGPIQVLRAGYTEIVIGNSGSAAILQSNGNQDLILQTGNGTTGTITIVDGANGNITLAPNGAGVTITDGTIRPAANDDGSVGVSGTAYSDMFLASGAVIDFAAGNSVITHS
jgi:hypothetical protein